MLGVTVKNSTTIQAYFTFYFMSIDTLSSPQNTILNVPYFIAVISLDDWCSRNL